MASFDDQDGDIWVLCKTVCQNTACCTASNDNVVITSSSLQIFSRGFAFVGTRCSNDSGVGFAWDDTALLSDHLPSEQLTDLLRKQQMRHLPQHLPKNPKHKSTSSNPNSKLSISSILKTMPHTAVQRHVRHLVNGLFDSRGRKEKSQSCDILIQLQLNERSPLSLVPPTRMCFTSPRAEAHLWRQHPSSDDLQLLCG